MRDFLFKIKRNVAPVLRGILLRFSYIFNSQVTIGNLARIGRNNEWSLHPGCRCTIGKGLNMGYNTTIAVLSSGTLVVGDGVGIGSGNHIICHGCISIGNDTILGPNVMIYDHNHRFSTKEGVDRKNYDVGEVCIGNRCWIGAGTIILKGVHIGNNCIVGAGSVVTKNIPDNCVAVGNPAIIKKSDIDNGKKK